MFFDSSNCGWCLVGNRTQAHTVGCELLWSLWGLWGVGLSGLGAPGMINLLLFESEIAKGLHAVVSRRQRRGGRAMEAFWRRCGADGPWSGSVIVENLADG